ncbi:MAG: diguanylate cyclase [Terracidiphilus sp.]|jgi:diguanylate cyclase (GGDEF)-like protein
MKRLTAAFAIAICSAAWGAPPAPLTSLSAIDALSNAEAKQGLPVSFEATVTFQRDYEGILFVQDEGQGLYVQLNNPIGVVPGDRVLVTGKTRDSFHPIVLGKQITLVRHGTALRPVPTSFDQLVRGDNDGILVTVHGVIQSADLVLSGRAPIQHTALKILVDGGYLDTEVELDQPDMLGKLLDAEVEVTGVAGGEFDDKMQETGIRLMVPSIANVKILKAASSSPWSLPITSMKSILNGFHVNNLTPRVRVRGSITHYEPGTAVVLQDGAQSIWIMTGTHIPLRMGDIADATGIPAVHGGFLAIDQGEIQDTLIQAPVTPLPVTWRQLAHGSNSPDGHHYDLVSIEGQLVTGVREGAQDEYVLVSNGHLFSAIYHHPSFSKLQPLRALKQIPVGATARVVGICMPSSPNSLGSPVSFDLILNSPDDIEMVAPPSLLSVRNLILVVALLIAIVLAVGARGWIIERRVRRQTAALADIEHRRSHILEDINGSRPLAEIIEQITRLISFKLDGAPCWCQITDGARLGACPPDFAAVRLHEKEIPARSGPALGTLFAGLGQTTKLSAEETDALSMGAELATLAIETRRLYSDLLHRSEFDLLTDIDNRFSLDKRMDAQIEEARREATIFGLVYIDLDEFKQVNDHFGHRIGDLYLQQVAQRMKGQLRGVDTLARLGGDEFVALLPQVRNRAEVEEIARRIELCFNEPFVLEEINLQGAASFGIALFPEDGADKDSLFNAADSHMYWHKNGKRQAAAVSASEL